MPFIKTILAGNLSFYFFQKIKIHHRKILILPLFILAKFPVLVIRRL